MNNMNNMNNMTTSFGGLLLRSPVIVGSCSLTSRPERCLEYERAGAGAVVIKSIFEEEILAEIDRYDHSFHTEGYDYLRYYQMERRLDEYCDIIRRTKALCSIPVIASVCCATAGAWVSYAGRFEEAGADAVELNVMRLESDPVYVDGDLERMHVEMFKAVKHRIEIPVIVKIGHTFTNVIPLVRRLTFEGAAAVVLFNKMCPVDIDTDTLSFRSADPLSDGKEIHDVLRWVGLASAKAPSSAILASGGVLDGDALVKILLAGATAAEICSVLYKEGPEAISRMTGRLSDWMAAHKFRSLDEFRGRLDASHHEEGGRFDRIQFYRDISGKP
uniref:dihydroorotate dehydrogenase-like protein n=1 Tax=Candidatus Cryptobacteroides bacterium TaxID=3085639 RepID=UPI00402A4B77